MPARGRQPGEDGPRGCDRDEGGRAEEGRVLLIMPHDTGGYGGRRQATPPAAEAFVNSRISLAR